MITKQGLDEVERAYQIALAQERKASESLNDAHEKVEALREALNCDHPENQLEYRNGFMYNSVICHKCGYTWSDY